jgi:tetratricopeptide (TPR) repeat protein
MMKWMVIATALVVGALAGCQPGSTSKEARAAAYQRWHRTRATVLCGLASEYLKTGQLDEAAKKAKEAIVLDAECTDAHVVLGKAYIEKGQYLLATDELAVACRQKGDSSDVVYLLGVAQEKAGRLGEALASYRRAYQLDEASVDAVIAAGEVLVQMDRSEEAQAYVEFNLQAAGDNPGIYELAGRLAMMRKEYAKAAEHYQRASDLDIKNSCYLEALAQARFLAGQYEQAAETLATLAGKGDYPKAAWVQTSLGDCLLAMDRPAEARDAYYRAKDLQPDSPAAWVNIAKVLLACKDAHKAVLAAQEASRLQPSDTDAAIVLGYALIRDGRAQEALEVLKGAVGTQPADATLHCLLGKAHEAAGEETEADKCYAAALQLEPRSQLVRELAGLEGPSSGSRN